MIEWLESVDASIFMTLNGLHCAYLDEVMQIVSGKFVWIPMYAALLYVVVRNFNWRQSLVICLGIAIAIALADQTCSTLIRPIIGRLRPANLDNPISQFTHIVDGYRGGANGFPSCHAANSFALAVFMTVVLRRRAIVLTLFVWALLNSYSRIYLGVHYPGDLLAGFVVGSLMGLVIAYIVQVVNKKIGIIRSEAPRTMPMIHTLAVAWTTLTTIVVILLVAVFLL